MMKSIIRSVYYNTIREFLPRKIGVYHGVATRRPRLFDFADVSNDYEKELIEMIKQRASKGDSILLIGAGFGVSTIIASKIVGSDGDVIAYEASEERFEFAKEAVRINETPNNIDLRKRLVGEGVAVKGEKVPNRISPQSLPGCDLLIMDCEGAELAILSEIKQYPDQMIVETHGCFNSPTSQVEGLLDKNGHIVESRLVESESLGIDILATTSESDAK